MAQPSGLHKLFQPIRQQPLLLWPLLSLLIPLWPGFSPSLPSRQLLNQELTKIEKPAGIANPKDFRNEVVKFALRSRAQHGSRNPSWTSYEKLREVIERRMFSQVEELLPVISFGSKKDGETEKKHGEFVERMVARGYTERQVRRLVEWYMRVKQAG